MHDAARQSRWRRFQPQLRRIRPKFASLRPRAVVQFLRRITSRVYALVLMLVLCYAGLRAFGYLYDTVFHPLQLPKPLMHWQARTDVAALRGPDAMSVTPETARAPLAHYHEVVRPFQAEQHNGCTIAGCHQPLPHDEKMKVPAFANFHVAFLACQSCHTQFSQHPVSFVWMNIQTGQAQSIPAVLRLTTLLHEKSELIATQPSAVQPDLLTLLAEILEVRPDDALLENLRTQIETTEPGSPLWSISIKRLESQLPGYARGSYGAKLIPEEQFAKYDQTNRRLATLAQRYFASSIDSARQKALDDEIHTGVNRHPAGCMLCHTDSNGLLDFTAAGYLPERANRLKNLQLAHLMEDIRHGKQFRLPTLVEESNAK